MLGLAGIDIAVIVGYFAVVIAIGVWASRHIRNQTDYFLAGRKFGKFIQTFASFGQGTSADNAVGVTTTTFSNGIAGVWSSLLYLFATPMYWMVMPWMRRLRLISLGDFFVVRAFLEAVRRGGQSPIDAYDAAAWSSIIPLSAKSIAEGGAPQEIPDFTRGKWETRKA